MLRRLITLAAILLTAGAFAPAVQAEPALKRIKMATFTAPDLREVELRYLEGLDYKVRERGKVTRDLARSWGAPAMAGRPYILMSPDGHADVFIRAVHGPLIEGYRPLTTWGWNAIELIVDDPDALHERLKASPFEVIGEPAPLQNFPSIRALQVQGSSQEVLYLASERGDRSKSILPLPNGFVGRIFIMVVAGPDIEVLLDWYTQKFNLQRGQVRERVVGVLKRAQNLAEGETLPLTTVRLQQHGNLIELDGYSERTGPRPQRPRELPPGVAMSSFTVANLDALELEYITPPAPRKGAAYEGRRSAVVRGPAGELIELIEEP
jgi:hypothetical protein